MAPVRPNAKASQNTNPTPSQNIQSEGALLLIQTATRPEINPALAKRSMRRTFDALWVVVCVDIIPLFGQLDGPWCNHFVRSRSHQIERIGLRLDRVKRVHSGGLRVGPVGSRGRYYMSGVLIMTARNGYSYSLSIVFDIDIVIVSQSGCETWRRYWILLISMRVDLH